MIELTILGNNSALPAFGRHPTAQLVSIREQMFLVDCGESTQNQLQKYSIGWRRINYIFISHLHGDHYFGLIGLLTSMGLLGRVNPIFLYGPPELQQILDVHLKVANTQLPFKVYFVGIEYTNEMKTLVDNQYYSVQSFPVQHRIPCHGFLFSLKNSGRKILPEFCAHYNVPFAFYKNLKAGEDFVTNKGEIIKNEILTSEGNKEIKYAYCADTLFTTSYHQYINGANAIYHESTYLKDNTDKAIDRFHSTAEQAATAAKMVNAQQLFLGHYSSRYQDVSVFETEAKSVFPNSIASIEGTTYSIE